MLFKCRINYNDFRLKYKESPFYKNKKEVQKFLINSTGCDYAYNYNGLFTFVLVFSSIAEYAQFKLENLDLIDLAVEHK